MSRSRKRKFRIGYYEIQSEQIAGVHSSFFAASHVALSSTRERTFREVVGNRALQVQPVSKFKHQRAVLAGEMLREIILGVYDEEIRGGLISPLEPGVQIHIIQQVVILKIRGQEKFVGESKIDAGADQEQLLLAIVVGELHIVIIN